jgi:hypothetical protein
MGYENGVEYLVPMWTMRCALDIDNSENLEEKHLEENSKVKERILKDYIDIVCVFTKYSQFRNFLKNLTGSLATHI